MFAKESNQSAQEWLITEKGYNPKKIRIYETLFTLGNGYLGHRASYEERPDEGDAATFIAGIFDKSEAMVPQLVKSPVWVDFSIWIDDIKFDFYNCRILSHERNLDMYKGILHRKTTFKGPNGKIVTMETRRVVFAHQVRGAAMEISVTPENFSGEIKVISGLNGHVVNVGYYPEEKVKHLNLVELDRTDDHIYLEMQTRDKEIKIGLGSTLEFKNPVPGFIKVNRIYAEKISEEIIFKAAQKKSYFFTKWASIYSSREGYEKQLKSATLGMLQELMRDGIDYQIGEHVLTRAAEWKHADIEIKGDPKAEQALRFCIYHMIIAKPHHDPTVSLGAKFLTGEGYKGHCFWDTEIFMLPFYIYTFPDDAANLLKYRYYTLAGAQENAKSQGYKGAKIAWESADTGEETTPKYGYLPDGTAVRIWTGDEEHHIVSDVIYAVYNYYKASLDKEFLFNYGADVILQTAKFWLTRVEKRRDRYEIRKVIGPDEYHEHVDNNAFTNYLVTWHIDKACDLHDIMKREVPELLKKAMHRAHLSAPNINEMRKIAKLLYLPYDQKTDLMEQFEGYFGLEDITIKHWDKQGMPYIANKEKIRLNKTRLIKQADVVLLMYMFLDKFNHELKKKNYRYYEARTMHESSLSMCTYAIMGLEIGEHKRAYSYFMKTAQIDLLNLNKNAADGIHGAAMGGAWQMAIHGFAGMKIRQNTLCFDPWLPKRWKEFNYNCFWHGKRLCVRISHDNIIFRYAGENRRVLTVNVQGKPVQLQANKETKVKLIPGHEHHELMLAKLNKKKKNGSKKIRSDNK
ncbi:MAG: glycosyl hydrolase family 65 protein [bacterium]